MNPYTRRVTEYYANAVYCHLAGGVDVAGHLARVSAHSLPEHIAPLDLLCRRVLSRPHGYGETRPASQPQPRPWRSPPPPSPPPPSPTVAPRSSRAAARRRSVVQELEHLLDEESVDYLRWSWPGALPRSARARGGATAAVQGICAPPSVPAAGGSEALE